MKYSCDVCQAINKVSRKSWTQCLMPIVLTAEDKKRAISNILCNHSLQMGRTCDIRTDRQSVTLPVLSFLRFSFDDFSICFLILLLYVLCSPRTSSPKMSPTRWPPKSARIGMRNVHLVSAPLSSTDDFANAVPTSAAPASVGAPAKVSFFCVWCFPLAFSSRVICRRDLYSPIPAINPSPEAVY